MAARYLVRAEQDPAPADELVTLLIDLAGLVSMAAAAVLTQIGMVLLGGRSAPAQQAGELAGECRRREGAVAEEEERPTAPAVAAIEMRPPDSRLQRAPSWSASQPMKTAPTGAPPPPLRQIGQACAAPTGPRQGGSGSRVDEDGAVFLASSQE